MRSTHPYLPSTSRTHDDFGAVSLDEADVDDVESNPLVVAMRGVFIDPNYRPPAMPRVALQLHALSRLPETSVKDIELVLASDPILAGTLMKRSQSALFCPGGPARSIHEAIVRLGLRAVADMCLEVAMKMRVFRCQPYEEPMEKLLLHSTAVAHFAQLISRRTSMCADHAFFVGLMHDVGSAACLIALSEYKLAGATLPSIAEAWPAITHVHADASSSLATAWGLPDDITRVLRDHHQVCANEEDASPALAILALAERFATLHGFESDASSDDEWSWALRTLRLPGLLDLEHEAEALGERLREDLLV